MTSSTPRRNQHLRHHQRGIRFAVCYTKLKNRLLAPLREADRRPAPLEIRRALAVIDHGIHDYVEHARMGTAA
jgi:hypothetical protein